MRFFAEQLEDRRLLAVYSPTTALDPPLAAGFVSAPSLASAQQDGSLSLREAVILANYTAGRDTIELQAGTTYQLSIPGSNEDNAASGDLDIRDDLNIVVADGGSAHRDVGTASRKPSETACSISSWPATSP